LCLHKSVISDAGHKHVLGTVLISMIKRLNKELAAHAGSSTGARTRIHWICGPGART
jgi:hypothetical protein